MVRIDIKMAPGRERPGDERLEVTAGKQLHHRVADSGVEQRCKRLLVHVPQPAGCWCVEAAPQAAVGSDVELVRAVKTPGGAGCQMDQCGQGIELQAVVVGGHAGPLRRCPPCPSG